MTGVSWAARNDGGMGLRRFPKRSFHPTEWPTTNSARARPHVTLTDGTGHGYHDAGMRGTTDWYRYRAAEGG